ncbi:hypothetical protein [Pseudonocardia spinosispora]|uniref:hypothetical protein n=1 Tax=Pseudonocardia spinosispora TaxID=103441 RepID=UPI0012EBECDA|nr:hypothetical protein [Pseudonocardia spinosispora]
MSKGPVCPTEHQHRFTVADTVTGIALTCPNCVEPQRSVVEELAEIVSIGRRTLAGLAQLPARARDELDASGTVARLCQTMVTEVRDAAERCRSQLGTELPLALRTQVAALLDAAGDNGGETAVSARWL